MFSADVLAFSEQVLDAARRRGVQLATAESCTGGLIAAALTAIPGSSDVVDRGFVVYSNQAKTELLGVAAATIERYGAVSPEVAIAMAEGALTHSSAQIAVSCTGIAGPGGGGAEKPVGLVHLALASRVAPTLHQERQFGPVSRDEIRMRTVRAALQLLLEATRDAP